MSRSQRSCITQLEDGRLIPIHLNMPEADLELLVMQKRLKSKSKEWRALAKVISFRHGMTPAEYKRDRKTTLPRDSEYLISLREFEEELLNIIETYDERIYSHPAEWLIKNWSSDPQTAIPSWYHPGQILTLKEVLTTLKKTNPTQLRKQNRPLYEKWRTWILLNFHLSIPDFYRFFFIHRIPVIHKIKQEIDNMEE